MVYLQTAQTLELVSPLQVTHLPPVCDFLLPLAKTPDRRDPLAISVSSERHRQMWGERNYQNFETAVGGIEPPSPQLTVRRSTAWPPFLTHKHRELLACPYSLHSRHTNSHTRRPLSLSRIQFLWVQIFRSKFIWMNFHGQKPVWMCTCTCSNTQ